MLKKVFALASLTALTGAVAAAGCSSSTPVADADSGTKDASSDRTILPEDSGWGTCPSTEPVAASDLPWAPPTSIQAGRCAEDHLTAIQQYIKDNPDTDAAKLQRYVKTVSATCHDCVFTDASKATWGPLPISDGKLVTINLGGCLALESGNVACGKAVQNEVDCELRACAACPADARAVQTCKRNAQSGACKPYVQAAESGCKDVPQTVREACGDFVDAIRIQCVGADDDAGTDAGTDAGDAGTD